MDRRSLPPGVRTRVSLIASRRARAFRIAALLLALTFDPHSATAALDSLDLTELSLEDLMDVEVTSVSKKPEPLSGASAAVFVVTGEQIRRSGAQTIADALRFVPGMQVARISSSWWAITARGVAGNYSNKLLVLIDGRSAYTTFFGGVYWNVQDVLLEDVDRIEVIRGPGATLWGANAVNGVINIITKDASNTGGTFFEAGAGNEEKGFASARQGIRLGGNGDLRVYGRALRRDSFESTDGGPPNDDWEAWRGGFRADWNGEKRHLTIQGDIYRGESQGTYIVPVVDPPYNIALVDNSVIDGGNVTARFTRTFSKHSGLILQAYYDRTRVTDARFNETRNTLDFELQHHWKLHDRFDLIWGADFRRTFDDTDSLEWSYVVPLSRSDDLVSGFAQADFEIVPGRLVGTVGSKLEHSDYCGAEWEPSVRVRWFPHEGQTIWAAVTRAVRTPTRIEHDGVIYYEAIPPRTGENTGPYPVIVTLYGNDAYRSEVVLAHEIGYRIRPASSLFIDATAFYNDYDDLRSVSPGDARFQGNPVSWVLLPLDVGNDLEAEAYGAEVTADWDLGRRVGLRASYSYLRFDTRNAGDANVKEIDASDGASPEHQAFLQASVDLPRQIDFDLGGRYVDRLSGLNVNSYFTIDARLAWRPTPTVEVAVVGRNLIEPTHGEFVPEFGSSMLLVQRDAYGVVTVRF